MHGFGTTTLIISDKDENETNEQKGGLLSMLFGTLGASLLGNLLSGKGIVRAGSGNKKRKRNCKSWLRKKNGIFNPASSFNKL